MKVASVDRIGSWRPPNADARAVTSNRLQTIAAVSASSVEPQSLASGTELPPMPVQRTQEAMSRPVLQSDKPIAAQPQFADSSLLAFRGDSVSTVEAFKTAGDANQSESPSGNEPRTAEVGADASSSKSLLERELAKQNPENLSALELASQAAARRAADQFRKEAAQPPQVPISKMLMDQVKSMWEASGKAVEAALAPAPSPTIPPKSSGSTVASSATEVTYSVPGHGAGSS